MEPNVFEFNELQYAETGTGPWKLYIYEHGDYHSGSTWFRAGKPKYPDEEITFFAASARCVMAMEKGLEVRVCDGGDMLVFHSQGGKIMYGENFWDEANQISINKKEDEK